ncbi:MAG: RNase A-like domain-containing protein [Acidimicrobiales bacterium]
MSSRVRNGVRRLVIVVLLGATLALTPAAPAAAHNCGSFNDCFFTADAASTALLGLIFLTALSIAIDFSPLGRARGIGEAIIGRDLLTGNQLSGIERLAGLVPGGRTARTARGASGASTMASARPRGAAGGTPPRRPPGGGAGSGRPPSGGGGAGRGSGDSGPPGGGGSRPPSGAGGADNIPGGGLRSHEGVPYGSRPHQVGHTQQRHVGQTDQQLRSRFDDNPRMTQSSTFDDLASADRYVGDTIGQNQQAIDVWLNNPDAGPRLNLDGTFPGEEVGRVLERGADAARSSDSVRVAIRRAPAGSDLPYVIITAFPS